MGFTDILKLKKEKEKATPLLGACCAMTEQDDWLPGQEPNPSVFPFLPLASSRIFIIFF